MIPAYFLWPAMMLGNSFDNIIDLYFSPFG